MVFRIGLVKQSKERQGGLDTRRIAEGETGPKLFIIKLLDLRSNVKNDS